MLQWNQFRTDAVPTITTAMVSFPGHNGDTVEAYVARPNGAGPFPGLVLIHHLPGWDEFYLELTDRFARHGLYSICPNLYGRAGHGTPDDIAAKVRGAGGVSDAQVVGDCVGALNYLKAQPQLNGKVGLIGSCSGGRHAMVVAGSSGGWRAAADLWGGRVVQDQLTEQQPVAPISLTNDISCPVIGIFGNDDQAPTPAQVDQHEAELKKHGKQYEFYRYDGAGHGFWYFDRAMYRQAQAMDSLGKVLAFFDKHLS